MLPGTYHEMFSVIATSAASLTGLLFVAISVSPGRRSAGRPPIVQQVRAAAALMAFTNALTVALFGLVPTSNVGYPATVVGVIGIFFSAAALRSILGVATTHLALLRHLTLVVAFLVLFGTEVVDGIVLLVHPHGQSPVGTITYLLIASLLIGVARAWELVGDRDTGIVASLAVLTRGDGKAEEPTPPPGVDDANPGPSPTVPDQG